MRSLPVLIVLLGALTLLPKTLPSQTLGIFQSTLDNRSYEVRQRGQSGLDIYYPGQEKAHRHLFQRPDAKPWIKQHPFCKLLQSCSGELLFFMLR